MAENCGDLVAARALNIHKIRIRVLHKALQLVFPLLLQGSGVEQILGERHVSGIDNAGKKIAAVRGYK